MAIPDTADIEVAWVPTNSIRLDDQSIDYGTVYRYRELMADGGHLAPPVINADHTIRDGRHRVLAHKMLMRDRVRVLIVTERDPN